MAVEFFSKNTRTKRSSKWDKKSNMGILLGYSDVGYKVLLNNKIIVARHVDIVEKDVKCIGIDYNDAIVSNASLDENLSDNVIESENVIEEKKKKIEKEDTERLKLKMPRKSTRDRKSPIRYPENSSSDIFVNYCKVDTPHTFEEAINSKDSKDWAKAMDNEIYYIHKNNTWTLVDRVQGEKILDVMWVFTRKSDGRYKARLVVRGFQQTDVIDDIYSPVARNQTLRILFSYCCQNGLIIEQMDVETAFLNGKVSSEIYVNQPKGYNDGTNRVYKLTKALYGLRRSPRAWYECFDEYITGVGFKRSNVDYCLYTYGKGTEAIYLLMYVDDLLICGKSKEKIQSIKKAVKNILNEKSIQVKLRNILVLM